MSAPPIKARSPAPVTTTALNVVFSRKLSSADMNCLISTLPRMLSRASLSTTTRATEPPRPRSSIERVILGSAAIGLFTLCGDLESELGESWLKEYYLGRGYRSELWKTSRSQELSKKREWNMSLNQGRSLTRSALSSRYLVVFSV